MDVHAAASLSGRDLGCKADGDPILVAHLAQHPLGNVQLVGRVFHIGGKEFNLILLIFMFLVREVPHLRMGIFDQGARLGHGHHGVDAQLLPLNERL